MKVISRFSLISVLSLISLAVSAQTNKSHVVQQGETLQSISQMYGISEKTLREANAEANVGDMLFPGVILSIPLNREPAGEEVKEVEIEPLGDDTISMRDGSIVTCTILEVGKTDVKLKQDDDEHEYFLSLKEVARIKYKGGAEKIVKSNNGVFTLVSPQKTTQSNKTKRPVRRR